MTADKQRHSSQCKPKEKTEYYYGVYRDVTTHYSKGGIISGAPRHYH